MVDLGCCRVRTPSECVKKVLRDDLKRELCSKAEVKAAGTTDVTSKYKTGQELWATILKTFGGNEATKKTKKNLLKQHYGNFKAEGSETLEQTFNSLQVIIGQLQFMDVEIEQDDLNQKFLTSLAPEWRMHAIIKFNDINQIDEDDIEEIDIKWNMALLSMRADKFWKRTGKKISIQRSDVAGFDKSKVEFFNSEEKSSKALMAIDEVGWDWSYMANEEDHALEENDVVDGKLARLLKSSKDLENIIESQRSEMVKEGVGYNAVPPPTADLYLSLKKDLSWTGLPEFVDDTVTDNSRPSPTIPIKNSYRALWVPTVNRYVPPVSRKFSTSRRNFPTANRNFPTASKKFTIGSTKNHTADMGRKGKAVKPSACWTWNPSQELSNKVQTTTVYQ
nr:hypothetical protein [Tanacetum cinerariifolium]